MCWYCSRLFKWSNCGKPLKPGWRIINNICQTYRHVHWIHTYVHTNCFFSAVSSTIKTDLIRLYNSDRYNMKWSFSYFYWQVAYSECLQSMNFYIHNCKSIFYVYLIISWKFEKLYSYGYCSTTLHMLHRGIIFEAMGIFGSKKFSNWGLKKCFFRQKSQAHSNIFPTTCGIYFNSHGFQIDEHKKIVSIPFSERGGGKRFMFRMHPVISTDRNIASNEQC